MKDFAGKVAVVTGGASGIGRAMAERFAQAGMRVVLADVEEPVLRQAAEEMTGAGMTVLPVVTDVSHAEQVEALAQQTLAAFGAVHIVCNNAGVGAGSTVWESTLADWEWVLGVNLWGVIHGIRTFTPLLLKQAQAQGAEGHIVNTASIAGLVAGPGLGAYKASKFAVVSLSETLYYELAQQTDKISVSVLCPMWVRTNIYTSGRNRPTTLMNEPDQPVSDMLADPAARALVERDIIDVAEVAERVFAAVRDKQLYILTHPASKRFVQHRMEHILAEQNPPTRMTVF